MEKFISLYLNDFVFGIIFRNMAMFEVHKKNLPVFFQGLCLIYIHICIAY